jgi:hypothetical protein
MEPNDLSEQSITSPANVPVVTPSQGDVMPIPPVKETSCPTCAAGAASTPASYIYAIGRIEARFPKLTVEKEFAQVTGRAQTAGKNDRQVFHEILSAPENRYLARQMCWVLTIQGLETYILIPRDSMDFSQLVGTIRSDPSPNDIDLVVGLRGPIASPEFCNGLMLPIVLFDQLYSFDRDTLIKSIPRPEKIGSEEFGPTAAELFDTIMQMTDNAGSMDEHRALNYLAVGCPDIYAKAAERFANDFSLSRVETQISSLSSTRKIVEVIFSHTNRNTDFTEQSCVRVDVTEEFPFLVTKLSPYFNR